MDFQLNHPDSSEILRRDRIRFQLQALVAEHEREAKRAGASLAARIQAEIDRLNSEKRDRNRRMLALMEVARDLVIDRETMEAPSDLQIDPENPPEGFGIVGIDVNDPQPCWVKRAYEALGCFDINVWRDAMGLVSRFEFATSGQIDNCPIKSKADLAKVAPLEAYVQIHRSLRPQDGEEELRADLDPDTAVVSSATRYWSFGHVALKLLREDPGKIRPSNAWWEIAVAILICADPEFEPAAIGVTGIPSWDNDAELTDFWDQFYGTRSGLFEHFRIYTEDDWQSPDEWRRRFWLLAERAVEHLPNVPTSESRAPTARRSKSRVGQATPRSWTQRDLDDAIRNYTAKRASRYRELVDARKENRKGSLSAAQRMFGRNAIARALGVKSTSMVSRSQPWIAIAKELRLPLNRGRVTGTRATLKRGKVGFDLGVEEASQQTDDDHAPDANLIQEKTKETERQIRRLPAKQARPLMEQYHSGEMTGEQARQAVQVLLAGRK